MKSMGGEQLRDVEVTERGVLGDRAYALIDKDTGKVVSAKSAKLFPKMLDCKAAFVEPPRRGSDLPPVQILLPNGTEEIGPAGVARACRMQFQDDGDTYNRSTPQMPSSRHTTRTQGAACPETGRRIPSRMDTSERTPHGWHPLRGHLSRCSRPRRFLCFGISFGFQLDARLADGGWMMRMSRLPRASTVAPGSRRRLPTLTTFMMSSRSSRPQWLPRNVEHRKLSPCKQARREAHERNSEIQPAADSCSSSRTSTATAIQTACSARPSAR